MSPDQPSLDAVFELLAARRRRYALYYLAEAGEDRTAAVEDVAAQVVEWEREWDAADSPGSEPDAADSAPTDRRERVRIDLYHNHLPRLADAGLVDYDARTGTVRSWEAPSLDRWVPDDSEELPRLRRLLTGESPTGAADGSETGDGPADEECR